MSGTSIGTYPDRDIPLPDRASAVTSSATDCRCVLVTGATAGIGRELARSIARLSSKLTAIAVGRRQERLEELEKEGLEIIQFDSDTDEKGISSFVDKAIAHYPQLDGIVLCAGVQKDMDLKKDADDQGTPSVITTVSSSLGIVPAACQLVESELHDEEGTTEKLSSFWVPLDKYIESTKKGLKAGDGRICYDNEAK
ncbi:hypothetical protein CC1G_14394 [Coprinopsis cinerea okayama7|uniref:NAD(P)-binding domain-containing protein n=1 Tax=Coprinopsis cinerea (strain Okayama-7 / 130 / ATCC MYA-4618 / FGSC 9003) TaxID=240176 RepID=D6RM90_COPC7|nr:hypothetical protein CC1G_14394 [Coprinopsis cinerea okayama7\|eukprot:XP_002911397.1 hypothetical protein CC1G_14394 [Coprinopsis cinerea okayama7\